jgi:hypothetical protein
MIDDGCHFGMRCDHAFQKSTMRFKWSMRIKAAKVSQILCAQKPRQNNSANSPLQFGAASLNLKRN